MGNPLTKAVGNVLTRLMGNVLTEILGKVLDIYRKKNARSIAPRSFAFIMNISAAFG